MNINVTVNIPTQKILRSRGFGGNTGLRKYVADEVKRLCDPYVPMQQGHLKNNAAIAGDGSYVIYTRPYAHYQYYGRVMAGKPPKSYTGRKLTYHGAPMRGAMWEKRMLADKAKDLEKSAAAYIKQRGG